MIMEDSYMLLSNCQISNYKIMKQIGSGAYGLVFHVADIFSNANFAMKVILKSHLFHLPKNVKKTEILLNQLLHDLSKNDYKLSLSSVDLESIVTMTDIQLETNPQYKELQLHLKVHSHPNVVTIHQVMESNFATFIIMDYYPTDLFTSIVDDKHFTQDGALVKKAMIQLSSVLEYCSLLNVYHCDLKPENILLDKFDNLYLCDFGLATTSKTLDPNICIGSSYYMAPERINIVGNEYSGLNSYKTVKGDIWSLGILLINLTCIRNPWAKASITEDKTFAYFIKNPTILQKILPVSNELLSLLMKILVLDPIDRIPYEQIRQEIINIQSFTLDGPLSKVEPMEQSFLQHSISTGTVIPSTTTRDGATTSNVSSSSSSSTNQTVLFDDTIDKADYLDYSRTTTPCDSDLYFKNYQTHKTNSNSNSDEYNHELKNTLLQYEMNLTNFQSSNEFLQF